MTRRVLNFLTALSLMLCVAACVLWVRSLSAYDVVRRCYSPDGRLTSKWYFESYGGRLAFGSAEEPDNPADAELYFPNPPAWWLETRPYSSREIERAPGFWGALGFDWHWDRDALDDGYRWRAVQFPLWLPALAFASAPAAAAWRLHRCRERSRRSLCPKCGYDLRATPGRCPECGMPVVGGTISGR